MPDAIVALNVGSSSIKFALYAAQAEPDLLIRGKVEPIAGRPRFVVRNAEGDIVADASWDPENGADRIVARLLAWLRAHCGTHGIAAVGHRVVHGGTAFPAPVKLDATAMQRLEDLVPLAPLHQPQNLAPIRGLLQASPDLLQVACFDTAFHRQAPEVAQRFALPEALTCAGIRRYGFHGLSYEYIASVLPRFDPRAAQGRTIVLHLGNGASLCALDAGRSVATTMGFTALDGVPMGTRCGALDPGVLLYLMDQRGMDARAIERLLYHESGLLGVSGISSDVRELLDSPDERARFALDLFVYRIGRELGSLAAALGGVDALVFTAGIGEHAQPIRAQVCRQARWLGVEFDEKANAAGGPRLTTDGSPVAAWVIPTDEELIVARHTNDFLSGPAT